MTKISRREVILLIAVLVNLIVVCGLSYRCRSLTKELVQRPVQFVPSTVLPAKEKE